VAPSSLQQFFLALGELGGSLHADFYEEISGAAAVEDGDALILEANGRAGLCAFGNFERLVAAERGDGDFRAERGLH